MKNLFLILGATFIATHIYSQVGIGTTDPSPASMLEISSTSDGGITYGGFMPPRVPNIAARDAINPSIDDVGLEVFIISTGALQMWNGTNWENIHVINSLPIEPWINEFHYDNTGLDVGEFIEIAGPAGIDLGNYRVYLYNGSTGLTTVNVVLSGLIDDESSGYGALTFTPSSLQNDMEGMALVKRSNNFVIQFISYEGAFVAANGPANGMLSIDIGVEEDGGTGGTPIGYSLQLTGNGDEYDDFNWNPPEDDSPGFLNVGQILE
jgi:hypothetical protein